MLEALAAFCSILDSRASGTYRDVKGVHLGIFIGSEEHTCTLGHRTAIRNQTHPARPHGTKHPHIQSQLIVHAGLNTRAL